MWPILQRELREQARQRSGHWLRVLGAAVVMAVLAFAWDPQLLARQRDGRGIFCGLNHVLVTAIWLIAPILTADCLSREKREGTLGLLFLTPLTARDVVVGKAFVHALRAFTIVLAAVPVLAIPVLMGGVGWLDALRMLLLQLAVLGLALVAGLVASSVTTHWLRARLLAFVMVTGTAGAFLLLNVGLSAVLTWIGMGSRRGTATPAAVFNYHLSQWLHRLGYYGSEGSNFWKPVTGAGSSWVGLLSAGTLLLCSLALIWLAVRFATIGIRRTWQTLPSPPKAGGLVDELTRLRVSRAWWRRKRSALLNRNPVVWRNTSTWSARMTTAGWLIVTMVLASRAVVNDGWADAGAGQWLGRQLLLVGMAFAAASSFREEKDSGGLELLLVTPLSPTQLIGGRLRGMFRQFAPSVTVLLLVQATLLLTYHLRVDGMRTDAALAVFGLEGAEFLAWMAATAALGLALAFLPMAFLFAFGLAAVAHHAALTLGGWLGALFQLTIRTGANRWGQPAEWSPVPVLVSLALAGATLFVTRRLAVRRLERRSFVRAAR
ncbi:MAG TPA: ABC transporter permease subunit [Candidatus Limnocylindria bacterium]|nr:ABC transporter permease subunit [Candidatus Limnocylindria bacterium]